jgi:diguanylate cyclase
LLTLLSFLLCVLVVGVAAFIVSNYRYYRFSVVLASLIMGTGIVLMHYLGMHAVIGNYMLHHDQKFSVLAAVIAAAASYGALRMFESEVNRVTLAISALIFGLAVSGMHYTAMIGMVVMPVQETPKVFGPSVSSDTLMIVVAVLAFIVSAVFLLYLIPEKQIIDTVTVSLVPTQPDQEQQVTPTPNYVQLVPVESEGATKLFPVSDIHSIHASTHYALVYDGLREHFSPWSITDMENKLDPILFMRVHRSHLVAVNKVKSLRKSGDSAVLEIGIGAARTIPVSRNNYGELKERLGLHSKLRNHGPIQKIS